MYESWGYQRLGKKTYEESVGEMKHADALIKRILLLEGFPNLQDLHKLGIGESVPEGLAADLEAERRGRATLVAAIQVCETKKDFVSRDLLTDILDDTEEHIDFLETEIDVLGQVGLQNYLQSQYSLDRDTAE
jgi:bacterioferritin